MKLRQALEFCKECGCDDNVESCLMWIDMHWLSFTKEDLEELEKDVRKYESSGIVP
jgi:hypothetical protein